MYFYVSLLAGIGAIAFIITVLLIFLSKARNSRVTRIRDASLTCEELEDHAAKTAIEHTVGKKRNFLHLPGAGANDSFSYILEVYNHLNEDIRKKHTISPAAEWLLDNFYIVEEQVKGLRRNLTRKEYSRLPVLKCGPLRGRTRIYAVAAELIAHTDGQLDDNIILKYLNAYQTHSVLLNSELLALPAMLRLALIQNIRAVCERIMNTQYQWNKADEIIDNLPDKEAPEMERLLRTIKIKLKSDGDINPSFIEHLLYKLRRTGRAYNQVYDYIDKYLARHGMPIDDITRKEHYSQAVNAVSMGNCITSLKYLANSDWTDIFESASIVERILNKDPGKVYPVMDISSKNHYRKRIEVLASYFNASELHIANEAVGLAGKAPEGDARLRHVGYYLSGKGVKILEDRLGRRRMPVSGLSLFAGQRPEVVYLGSICIITAALAAAAIYYTTAQCVSGGIFGLQLTLYALLAGLTVILPASEIAVNLVNWIVCNIKKPGVFPRLELKDGIPADLSTMIVIPALLTDENRVKDIMKNLENHFLVNREDNLYFALVGDFRDSSSQCSPEDAKIIDAALDGIKDLNRRYSAEGRDIFQFFYRQRSFNDRCNRWMGWERKRGALLEFNEMLLGSDLNIRFVITLDADTILPIGMAKKMIGTMAHPLNRPVVDDQKGIVTEGFGLIQPRVSFGAADSNRSLFSRIFTGQKGIDAYSFATSDVYQDMFGEGIYTGKGIYDLHVFQKVLKSTIPDNTVLSHDLLEGAYLRTGLVTDLELMDSYPPRYNSFIARLHRWVRGDWQLIPWLGRYVRDRNGHLRKNPLSLISKWKIADNMRRSLVSPSIILLIILGFWVLPGSRLLWFGFGVVSAVFPHITAFIDHILSRRLVFRVMKRYMPSLTTVQTILLQAFVTIAFLPYQAYVMLDATIITLIRVFFTRRNMLEWITTADAEKSQKHSLRSYYSKMYISVLAGLSALLTGHFIRPSLGLLGPVLFFIWGLAPYMAYRTSLIYKETLHRLSREDDTELRKIARKTWRYFEELANFKNHYLVPDNYQEDPPKGVASRTSPTNIGLGLLAVLTARDLGYIGIIEMTDKISNTLSTMEKMEKWNGHLYNWYDTRTLRPLRPRYISTVDSGNLVCYLMTLVQGLYGYLDTPLIEQAFAEGLKDLSAFCGNGSSRDSLLCLLAVSDAVSWNNTLKKILKDNTFFSRFKSPWRAKAEHMARMLRNELLEFMSWIDLAENVPQGPQGMAAAGILETLKNNIRLGQMPEGYRKALGLIDREICALGQTEDGDGAHHESLVWLRGLREEVAKSLERTVVFIERYMELVRRVNAIANSTRFLPLYAEKKQLFSVGYNIEENRLTNSYYDLFASEARQTSYIAIARGEVPLKHWFRMGRTMTTIDGYKGLVSWTGTMFEYLMPLLIMKSYKNTLLDETYSFVIRSQKKYGRQRNIPWGVSESGFYSLDVNLDYQYKAIGVPWLGLKRGLAADAVVAPYATCLAIMVDPQAAMENIKELKAGGMIGPYGFYEAVDYTPERLSFGVKRAIVKSFMAHHQGMSLVALNNYLNQGIMQERFHSDPIIRASQLLLQEKVPANVFFTKETKEKVVPFKDMVYKVKGPLRRFRAPDLVLPRTHILSNGSYSVILTDKGTGYSKNKMVSISRWREDSILDRYGMFFYVRDTATDAVWSAAYAPFDILPDKYEVAFMSDKARFRRQDGEIETETEIIVTSGDNAEIRRVSFKNHGTAPCVLEITSYFEVVLAPQAADVSHPAFSNLFVRTGFLPEKKCVYANRRPRSEMERSLWIAHSVVADGETACDLQYETDRMQFIGRGRSVSAPAAMDRNRPLTNTTGPVLDPIMALRYRIRVEPGKKTSVSFITVVSESNEALMELVDKYSTPEAVEGAFRLAFTRSQVESMYLDVRANEIELYQDIIPHILFISPQRRLNSEMIAQNSKGQSSLWSYGISGDLPIILVVLKKSDETGLLFDAIKAHEYWRLKDLKIDLVILNDEEASYGHPLYELLSDIIASSHAGCIVNKPGGIFLLNRSNMPAEDISLLYAASRFVLKGENGTLAEQVKKVQGSQLLKPEKQPMNSKMLDHAAAEAADDREAQTELDFFNGLGGFNKEANEYVIRLEKAQNTPMPWVNVIANPVFGFIVSESGGGYAWYENSRQNKLSLWTNDPAGDTPGEVLYINDTDTGDLWTMTPLPIREDEPYIIRHGFGYSVFEHVSHGIEQSMVMFAPVDDPVKVGIVRLKNISEHTRNIAVTYYMKPVLGVTDQGAAMHIRSGLGVSGEILLENPYNDEFSGKTAFVFVSEKERSITADRKEFFGSGGISSPEAVRRRRFSNATGTGYDTCAAIHVNLSIGKGEQKEVVLLLGMCDDLQRIEQIIQRYRDVNYAEEALAKVREFWKERLEAIQVATPDSSMDIMMNGWLLYQTISCRLWARSSFYQSGGAFGFRDQLQDSLAVIWTWPEIARRQILLHASRQFIEGDVQHWWHEPGGKGTRTRISDDLLWLPYVVCEYIRITGDYQILDEAAGFLEDELLREFEDEKYGKPTVSQTSSTLYDHCIRAVEKSLRFGAHGLPLIGSGDWNDSMNTVGNRDSGESVWLGWFMISVLKGFSGLCARMDEADRAARYMDIASKIAAAIDAHAWDGSWYRRAFFDNGVPLGSAQNSECRIDSLAQSWAVISGAGDPDKIPEAMDSLEHFLAQKEEGLIKLLTPPFDEGELEPGYIKGYVPGVRENGGQYTHAAAWVIMAFALMGDGEKAHEYFHLINPINHTRTRIEYLKYRVEPYVMAADVYTVQPHTGRGGWTWYTGAASWMYNAGLAHILGFKKNGDTLVIDPCIPKKWVQYTIKYRYNDTLYVIDVKNPEGVNRGVVKVLMDGVALPCCRASDNAVDSAADNADVSAALPCCCATNSADVSAALPCCCATNGKDSGAGTGAVVPLVNDSKVHHVEVYLGKT